MKVNIYYGGRGLIEDPTLFVINKIITVLDELNIKVKKYNLYEDKRGISMLPKTLKEADAVILAASVEWMGIGGLLWQFLDSCWLYGDKKHLSTLYMMPVVIATTYGEKDALFSLVRAWEMLGGIPSEGICAYVSDSVAFETSSEYAYLIERKTENFYRTFTKKLSSFPNSTNAVKENVLRTKSISLTPQESEQLSMYVSNDTYVKKQKEDIQELAQMFKEMMGPSLPPDSNIPSYPDAFRKAFHSMPNLTLAISWEITDMDTKLIMEIDNGKLECYYGNRKNVNVAIKSDRVILDQVISGECPVQTAFRNGNLTAKGNFKVLQSFDKLFHFVRL